MDRGERQRRKTPHRSLPQQATPTMQRDILNVSLYIGRKVRITISTWIGPREGIITGGPIKAGTRQVERWTVTLPHSRTKSRTYSVSVEAENLEAL